MNVLCCVVLCCVVRIVYGPEGSSQEPFTIAKQEIQPTPLFPYNLDMAMCQQLVLQETVQICLNVIISPLLILVF